MAMLAACIPAPAPSFDSPSPNARLEAIVAASDATDEESLTQLVAQLDADDPAARVLAITALHKRTGETLGYRAADSDWRRREAFVRWEAFLQQRAASPDAAAANPAPAQVAPAPPSEPPSDASEVTTGE